MTVIYKKQDIKKTIEDSFDKTHFGKRKDLKVCRCSNCFSLFNSNLKFHRKWCILCRIESKNEEYKNKCLEIYKKTWEELIAHQKKVHKDIKNRKENEYKAKKVTIINEIKSKRFDI